MDTGKLEEIMSYIGWQQVDDTHEIDRMCGQSLSTGRHLAELLLENAQNQSGVSLNDSERNEVLKIIENKFC
jgi:hypothetical protein